MMLPYKQRARAVHGILRYMIVRNHMRLSMDEAVSIGCMNLPKIVAKNTDYTKRNSAREREMKKTIKECGFFIIIKGNYAGVYPAIGLLGEGLREIVFDTTLSLVKGYMQDG